MQVATMKTFSDKDEYVSFPVKNIAAFRYSKRDNETVIWLVGGFAEGDEWRVPGNQTEYIITLMHRE